MYKKNIHNLSININAKPIKIKNEYTTYNIPCPTESKNIKILDIEETCKKYNSCHMCPYNLDNQASLLEFGKLIDTPSFKSKAFIGVLGTDTRIRCTEERMKNKKIRNSKIIQKNSNSKIIKSFNVYNNNSKFLSNSLFDSCKNNDVVIENNYDYFVPYNTYSDDMDVP
jgi:hypothetical protein